MDVINPPVITKFFKSVPLFFSFMKKTNPGVNDALIFDFIEKHQILCTGETVATFRQNLAKNLKIMTLSSVIAGENETEIRRRIDKMQLIVSVIALQNELKKFTIKES